MIFPDSWAYGPPDPPEPSDYGELPEQPLLDALELLAKLDEAPKCFEPDPAAIASVAREALRRYREQYS